MAAAVVETAPGVLEVALGASDESGANGQFDPRLHVPFGHGVLAGGGPLGAFLPDEGDLLGAFPSPCLGPPFPLPLALGVFFAPGSPFAGAFGFPGAPGACVSACRNRAFGFGCCLSLSLFLLSLFLLFVLTGAFGAA